MSRYLCCGNIMSDAVEDKNGIVSDIHPGGPAFYALAGVRLWTGDCRLVSQAGEDYDGIYGKWLDDNGISRKSVRVSAENCTQHILRYDRSDGVYSWRSVYGQENLGFLKTTPEHIEEAISDDTAGFYLAQNTDKVFWRKLEDIKSRRNVKMMWELEHYKDLRRVMDVIGIADMWSLNLTEASLLFDLPVEREDDIINRIMKMPVEMTLFRVGKRGAYCVTPTDAVFCPSVDIAESIDPTGCGNCSTGAAMYAHLAGHSPAEVVAMANISAGFNAAQFGPYPLFTEEETARARKLLEETIHNMSNRQQGEMK